MSTAAPFEIFLTAPPGLEPLLLAEVQELGFADPNTTAGGVTISGDWEDVRRANLSLRGATRVLARIGAFRAFHLAQLDKRARRFPWGDFLRPDIPVRIEATCKRSRIYHAGAAAQRIERAINEQLGTPISATAPIRIMARIDDDLCTLSIDTSGDSLHKRGHKRAVGKAPLRETLAALFLRQAGFDGRETLLDPMCGSGTFVLEAAEIAAGLLPGRSRSFAWQQLAGFEREIPVSTAIARPEQRFYGSDRDAGAIRMSRENALRAGVSAFTEFSSLPVSDLTPPDGAPPGLVIVNPPYGARISQKKLLYAVYATLGKVLQERFGGWRVALVTGERSLARATALPFAPPGPPVPNGGLKVQLFQTDILK